MWNLRRVQLQLVRCITGTRCMPAGFQISNADIHFVVKRDDSPILLRTHFELGNSLRFDLELRKLLIFRKHDLYGPACDLREVSDQGIESLRREPRRAE